MTAGASSYPGANMTRGTTTQRGYGWDHQQARARALAALRPGTPCPYCGHGMNRAMPLDYDHYPPLALGATTQPRVRRLAHSRCNRRAGQALGVARRNAKRSTRSTHSRQW